MKHFRWLTALLVGALLVGLASTAFAQVTGINVREGSNQLCPQNVDGWSSHLPANGFVSESFGTLEWQGSNDGALAYDINAGYVVEVCLKDGNGAVEYEITGAADGEVFTIGYRLDPTHPDYGKGGEISHVSYRVTEEPTETFEDLTVAKDAAGTYVRAVTWELDKFVNEEGEKLKEYEGDAGDQFYPNWLLFVTKNEALSGFQVSGKIWVTNPNDFDVPFKIEDKLSDGTVADVECTGFVGLDALSAPANGTVECKYTANPPNDTATVDTIAEFEMTNTVTIEWYDTDAEMDKSDLDDTVFSFTERKLIGVDSGTLTDDRFEDYSETVDADFEDVLSETFTCSTDPEDYTDGTYTKPFKNTAYLNDIIELDDDASVKLTCTLPPLEVEKDAKGTYDRTVTWELDKFVNEADRKSDTYSGGPGDMFSPNWLLFVTKTVVEDNYSVTGEITITNPANVTQFVTDVTDVLAEGTVADVDCDEDFPIEILAGEDLVCTYEASPLTIATTLNTVTVSAVGNEDQGAEATVWFSPNLIGVESGTLTDDRFDGNINPLDFEVIVEDDANFTLSETFVCPAADSDLYEDGFYSFPVVNTAYLNDEIELEDSAEVTVECQLRFKGETAWAANGNTSGEFRYTRRGNWATYVAYGGKAKSTTLFAGQTMNVGTVDFSGPLDGEVTITVNLSGDWRVDPDDMTLAVQDYEFAPSRNPSPGLFDWKATCKATSCTITVPENNFYGVHVNVGYWY